MEKSPFFCPDHSGFVPSEISVEGPSVAPQIPSRPQGDDLSESPASPWWMERSNREKLIDPQLRRLGMLVSVVGEGLEMFVSGGVPSLPTALRWMVIELGLRLVKLEKPGFDRRIDFPSSLLLLPADQGALWHRHEPPRNRVIVLVGNLVSQGEAQKWAEPICTSACWNSAKSDWCFASNNLPIRQSPADELVIHTWTEMPQHAGRSE